MTTPPDGLNQLDAMPKAARVTPTRKRGVLGSRHPVTKPPFGGEPAGDSAATSAPEQPAEQAPVPAPASAAGPVQPASTAESPEAPARLAAPLRKLAIYVDEDQDAVLEAIRYVGTSQRPRRDVTKSAVMRLAFERLLAEMSHDQIVEAIATRPTAEQATGRKRR